MHDHSTREQLIYQIRVELEQTVQTKRTLSIIAAFIAIEEGKLEDWINQFTEQMKPGSLLNLEEATSKKIVALMKQLQNTPQ